MFYDQLKQLCNSKGTTPTAFVKELGLGSSNVTRWKNGTMPNSDIILQFADYFNVTTDYLLRGVEIKASVPSEMPLLQIDSASQTLNYKNKVLHLKDDSLFTRFREARQAAHVSLEDAAAGSFLSVEDVVFLEDDNIPIREIDTRMKHLREVSLEQLSFLAYKYNVDLYWLLCGKVRPPAAIVQNGQLVYPPYEFMMETDQQLQTAAPPKRDEPKSNTPLNKDNMAERMENLFKKSQGSPDDDFDNVYPTDPEYNTHISWAAASGAQLDPVKDEGMQKLLRLHEKRGRLINEKMAQRKKEAEEK